MRVWPELVIASRPAERTRSSAWGRAYPLRCPSPRCTFVTTVALALALGHTTAAAEPKAGPVVPARAWIGPIDVTDELASAKQQAYARLFANEQVLTANQAAFDFHYYDLDLHPDPATAVLTGSVHALASVSVGPVSAMELDLSSPSMTVDGVTCAGAPTTFSHSANLLHVNLDRAYHTGELVNVTVAYHGTPQNGAFGNAFKFSTRNGKPHISTLSEPFDARQWWPCKDDPSDKADSADVRVTVPTGMITASNGKLVESTDNGTTAFRHWKCRHPIATYLVSIASYAYATSSDWYAPAIGPPMEIQFYIFPDMVAAFAPVNAKVKDMIAAYAARFGEYPFLDEKYGEAEFGWGGGMENQTCTSLGSSGEGVAAHELAHQWFGDAVTCRDFHHIWLNEGFASYAEALWSEAQGGASAYATNMASKRYLGSGTIYCPDVSDVYRVFSSDLSYRKPSWVLHMLRHILGDAVFFSALQAYQQQFGYGTAVTEDFQQVCESVSGLPLGPFFQEWIYGEYYPQYQATWSSAPAGGGFDVTLHLKQTQSGQLFQMPIDVRIQTNTAAYYNFVIQSSLADQFFTLHVPQTPTSLVIDPDNWILQSTTYPTAVALEPPTPAALALASPFPSPTGGPTRLSFSTPREGRVTLALFDAAGRRFVSLVEGDLPAGAHEAAWDGRDRYGAAAQSGIYWAVLDFAGGRVTRKIVVAR